MSAPEWTEDSLRDWLRGRVAELACLESADIGTGRPLDEYGLSSRDAVMLSGELEDLLDTELPTTLLWEQPTIGDLAGWLAGAAPEAPDSAHEASATEPIAVIGIGCRFPGGVVDPESFWELLIGEHDAVREVPAGRWDDYTPVQQGAARRGGFLDDVAGFDAEFFGITPREADLMDPQQRMLLEVSWEALEHAGIPPTSLAGSATGVFVGLSTNDYSRITMAEPATVEPWTATGAAGSIAANRLSYALDLRGPSLAVDTACSSSLVATHHAVRSLREGETGAALVGGVNLLLSPAPTLTFQHGGALAPDGRCKAFDASADGISRGEGCGVVLLKRLTDARRDGDRVLALIRGSATNSDGRSNGLTAPNPTAQRALLERAYTSSGVVPSTVDFVEAHGTGTLLGDPIEAGALGAVLGADRPDDRPLLLGSVKTNVGHTEAAAGIAGLIKVVLAMSHDRIPPGLHFTEPNPHIDFARSRLRVVTEPTGWPRHSGSALAGVSGFGFGGSNAHVVLQEPDQQRPPPPEGSGDTITVLAAKSPDRLAEQASALSQWLASPQGGRARPRDIGATLARHRWHATARAAVVAADRQELADGLLAVAEGSAAGGTVAGVHTGLAAEHRTGPVFVFSGYGSQWTGMGASLLDTDPAFAAAVDELDGPFREHAGFSLRATLAAGEAIAELDRVQLAVFGMQVALAAQWRALGVRPSAVIGHSMGEVAAAVVSGALEPADGVRVMACRSRLLSSLEGTDGGAMAAVELSEPELAELRARFGEVAIAVHGAADQLTIAGDEERVHAIVHHVEASGRTARLLPVRGAGHTSAVDPVLGRLRQELADVRGRQGNVDCYGTVHEDPRRPPAFDAGYWAGHARSPVRFAQAVAAAAADGHTAYLEIAPHPIAAGAVSRTLVATGVEHPAVAVSMRRGQDPHRTLRTNLGALYCAGVPVDWSTHYPDSVLVDLPRTRWRHRRHWFRQQATRQEGHPLLGVHVLLPGGDRHVWQQDVDHDGISPTPAGGELARAAAAEVFDVEAAVVTVHGAADDASSEPVGRLTTTLTVRGERSAEVDVHGTTASGRWVRIAAAVTTLDSGPTEPAPTEPAPTEPANSGSRPPAAMTREGLTDYLHNTVAGVMGFRPGELDPAAPLVELGLDSLMATRIRTAVERDLGVVPEAAAVLRGANMSAVVDHVAGLLLAGSVEEGGSPETARFTEVPAEPEAETGGPLRVLREGSGGVPLFLFHAAGGPCRVYRPLVEAMGGEFPCLGFERVPGKDLHERAENYLPLLREVQPHGPYRLAGWSFGGALAYAVACRLRTDGEEVGLVGLLDSIVPLPEPDGGPRRAAARRFLRFAEYVERTYGKSVPLDEAELVALPREQQIDTVMDRVSRAAPDMGTGVLRHQRQSFVDTLAAERTVAGTYDGRVLLLRAREPYAAGRELEPRYHRTDRAAGWDALCPRLDVLDVAGDHLSVVDPPHVEAVATHLTAALAESDMAGARR